MKRKQYQITSTVGHDIIKSTWNAGIRAIEGLARALANAEETTYTLTGSHSEKAGFDHVSGYRQWESATGKIVMFTITKLEEA